MANTNASYQDCYWDNWNRAPILGWWAKQFDRYPSIINVFAPQYAHTLHAYETMLISAGAKPEKRAPIELTPKDAGFDELLLLLVDDFTEVKNTGSVVKMRIKDVGLAAAAYYPATGESYSGAQPHFELTFNEGKPLSKYVNDLRPKIQKRFLDDEIFSWSSRFFWIGIFLSVVSLFIATSASPTNK